MATLNAFLHITAQPQVTKTCLKLLCNFVLKNSPCLSKNLLFFTAETDLAFREYEVTTVPVLLVRGDLSGTENYSKKGLGTSIHILVTIRNSTVKFGTLFLCRISTMCAKNQSNL